MSKVKIQTYRGFDILFSIYNEKFTYALDDTYWHEKQSISAVKKAIDEYVKSNANFKPFVVVRFDSSGNIGEQTKIVGFRKDGRFVTENNQQISDYSLTQFAIYDPANEIHYATISSLEAEIEQIKSQIKKELGKCNHVTLSSIKDKYIIK